MALKEMGIRDDDFHDRHPVFDGMRELPPVYPGDRVISLAGYSALMGGRQPEFDLRGQYGSVGLN